ncbi:MAG: CotH kinase family protein [Candidatus Ventricola sp.]
MKKTCLVMLLTTAIWLCLTAACAAEATPIRTAEDFAAFMQRLGQEPTAQAQLMNDIDMTGVQVQPAALLDGALEGNGFALTNLSIETDGGISALFLEIGAQGRVANLRVSGLFSGSRAACIAYISRGTLSGVTAQAECYATELAAGLVGENDGVIEGCENKGDVLALNGGMAGGVVGINRGSITGCTNYSALDGSVGTPAAQAVGGICAQSLAGSQVSDCVNLGRITAGERGAGLVAQGVSAQLRGLKNLGGVYGTQGSVAGVVCLLESGSLEDCANYGEVASAGDRASGIVLSGRGELLRCENHGAVSAVDFVAGIACEWTGTISGCRNHAPISGHDNTAGICTRLEGDIADCENRGEILGESHRTAGVVSELLRGTMARCANAGHVAGGTNHWGDSVGTGGVVALASAGVTMEDLCNTALVESSTESCGAIVAQLEGTLSRAVNAAHCRTVGSVQGGSLHAVYGVSDDGVASVALGSFYSGELSWQLNTDGGRTPSREAWSQLDDHPVLAGAGRLPTRKILCTYDGGEKTLYTAADGKLQEQAGFGLFEVTYTDEDGQQHAEEEILRKVDLFAVEQTVSVSTAWELADALSDSLVETVVLEGGIAMDRSVMITSAKRIDGHGYCLDMGQYPMEIAADVTVSELSLAGEAPVTVSWGTLSVEGFLAIASPVELRGGALSLNAGRLYHPGEVDGVPSIRSETADVPGYTRLGDGLFACAPVELRAAKTLVAPASENESLPCDIYPELRDGTVTFFLPCTADPAAITVCALNGAGEVVKTYPALNMTAGNARTVRLYGMTYPVQALTSDLPTLSFEIDESCGTIDAMNGSEDHSVYCYGDVRLDVPQALQARCGWEGFVSEEKNPDRPGSMCVRGYSTWSVHLDTKKPYQFQLEQKVDVLGMGKHKTWILLMNDEQLVRNKLGLDLAQDIGLVNSSLGEFVDVFMNGRYLGNYLLCECVEIAKERVNLAKLDDEYEENGHSTIGLDLTGGYLLEFDNIIGEERQFYHEHSDNTITVKEPEKLASEVNTYNAYAYICRYVTDFLNAVYGDGLLEDGRSYLDIIDVDSFARYFFHQEFLMNMDCGLGSAFMYKDRDSIDPLLYAGPVWDHDRIFSGGRYDGWALRDITHARSGMPTIYNQLSRRRDFVEKLIDAYEQTDIPEVLASASRHIDEYTAQLEQSARMNSLRWGLPELELSWMKAAMDERAAWIARNYRTLLDDAQ